MLHLARHVIQVPINKSSNYIGNRTRIEGNVYLEPPAVSNKLYCSQIFTVGANTTYNRGMGLGWDSSLIPNGKQIINAKLYLYTLRNHNRSIYYRYTDFSEGSSIPPYNPADGAIIGGISNGWDYIDIGVPKGGFGCYICNVGKLS